MSLETFSLYLFVGENAERSLNRFYYLRNCPAKYFAAIFSTIGEWAFGVSKLFLVFVFEIQLQEPMLCYKFMQTGFN